MTAPSDIFFEVLLRLCWPYFALMRMLQLARDAGHAVRVIFGYGYR